MPEYVSNSEEDTFHIGRSLGERLRPPCLVLLQGDLGSGKTVLAKGLTAGLGVSDPTSVHSPTFSLVNQYRGREGTIYHLDLYRLETLRELYSIGIEDILAADAVVIVEWAEKFPFATGQAMIIRITVDWQTQARRIEVESPR